MYLTRAPQRFLPRGSLKHASAAGAVQAAHYGNAIMVAHEDDQFQVVEQWEAVTEVDVQTPLEVYQELLGACGRSLSLGMPCCAVLCCVVLCIRTLGGSGSPS